MTWSSRAGRLAGGAASAAGQAAQQTAGNAQDLLSQGWQMVGGAANQTGQSADRTCVSGMGGRRPVPQQQAGQGAQAAVEYRSGSLQPVR